MSDANEIEDAALVARGRALLDGRRDGTGAWPWGYCLNAHPTETVPELRAALVAAGAVRRLAWDDQADADDATLGVELRLGIPAIEALAGDEALVDEVAQAMADQRLRAVAANGFPLTRFTYGAVKERVYEPDWTDLERPRLTLELARLMARLAAPEVGSPEAPITLSTLAGGFRPKYEGETATSGMLALLRRTADDLAELEQSTGRRVVLCLEPEPFTTLETTPEVIAFFDKLLDGPDGERRRRHLALNLDVCHQAVLFEDLPASLDALEGAGVPVAKVHVSAALRLGEPTAADLSRLATYDEPRYLHQTFVRSGGKTSRYVDLGDYLRQDPDPHAIDELRVHFHVPLHKEPAGRLESTRHDALAALDWLMMRPPRAIVLETYTWSVLLERGLVGEGDYQLVLAGLARELRWFAARVGERAEPAQAPGSPEGA